MAGNLSISREQSSGYSATELNALFDGFVTAFASTLPSAVRTQCSNEFDNISISDSDPIAAGIDSAESLYKAIAYLGENLQGDCEEQPESIATWEIGIVAGVTQNGLGMSVRDHGADADDDSGYIFGTAVATETGDNGLINPYFVDLDSITGNGVQRAVNLKSLAIADRITNGTPAWRLYIQQQGQRVPCSNTSTNGGNIPAFLGGNSMANRRFNGALGLQLPTIYSNIDIQLTSFSAGTTITLENATKQVVDGGLSDNTTLPRISIERFDGIGVEEWNPSLTSALTTLTIETFEQAFNGDLDSWNVDPPTAITTEPFSIGWLQGTQPTKDNCSGGGASQVTENLLSQINGSNQTFTLTRSYVSGSLKVYWNGQRQTVGDTITEDNDTQFTTTFTATVGTELIVDYVPR